MPSVTLHLITKAFKSLCTLCCLVAWCITIGHLWVAFNPRHSFTQSKVHPSPTQCHPTKCPSPLLTCPGIIIIIIITIFTGQCQCTNNNGRLNPIFLNCTWTQKCSERTRQTAHCTPSRWSAIGHTSRRTHNGRCMWSEYCNHHCPDYYCTWLLLLLWWWAWSSGDVSLLISHHVTIKMESGHRTCSEWCPL